MEWTKSNPVYPVADVAGSIEWYGRVFGFEPQHVNPAPGGPNYAVLARKGLSIIHLVRKGEGPHVVPGPVMAQFWVDEELDELFERVKALGVEVVESPEDRPWGHRDFMVLDPDRNFVWVTIPLPSAKAP